MNKLLTILHKKLDKNTSKILKTKRNQFDECMKEEKITIKNSTPFTYYEKECIYHGILNKRAIEKAYFDGYVKMHDYYDTLDYNEKKRLMNYEIKEVLKDLHYFIFDDQKIYIPFFDKTMNAIYENEMVLFQLKQYRRITYDYDDLFELDHYGRCMYNSMFSSLEGIYHDDIYDSYYSSLENRIYFLKENKYVDFISVNQMTKEEMYDLSDAYYHQDRLRLIEILEETNSIDEKLKKKLLKIEKKMR